MLYPYITLADETEISHTQVLPNNTVEVHFERPTQAGLDTARCVLPSYTWIINKGYSASDIAFFEKLLESNAHLIYRYAESGGINCA